MKAVLFFFLLLFSESDTFLPRISPVTLKTAPAAIAVAVDQATQVLIALNVINGDQLRPLVQKSSGAVANQLPRGLIRPIRRQGYRVECPPPPVAVLQRYPWVTYPDRVWVGRYASLRALK